jgi:hypothetical protein
MGKSKCYQCNKNTGMMKFTCKCNNYYCIMCRYPEEHNCVFNHKEILIKELEEKLIKVTCEKIEKI